MIVCLALTINSIAASNAEQEGTKEVRVVWDGEVIHTGTPVYVKTGRTFIPVRWIEHKTDTSLEWNAETNQLRVHVPSGDTVTFYINSKKIFWNGNAYFMDVESFISNGRIYLPTRYIADMVGLDIQWSNQDWELQITSNANKEFKMIANHESPSETAMLPYSEEDLLLLAKIIDAEAGNESYEGQVAVGSVVINRVKDSRFPDTIEEVIYQPNQFGPVTTGKIDQIEPDEDALRAAKQVLLGEDLLEDALYFFNPNRDSNEAFKNLTLVKDIGNHRFMK